MTRYGPREQGEQSIDNLQSAGSADDSAGTTPHPFTGKLIDGAEAAAWLAAEVACFTGDLAFCSAYLRAEALEALLARREPGLRGRVLVRWQLADLLAGASDLQAYQVAKAAGLQLLIRLDFHGKVFCLPGRGIVVGSANATLSGLGMRHQSNKEVCTLVPAVPGNLVHIEQLFAGAVLVDEQLFSEISDAVHAATQLEGLAGYTEWPMALIEKLRGLPIVDHLLASECLWSSPLLNLAGSIDFAEDHDRQLLGSSHSAITLDDATHKLQQTKIFRWLRQYLERSGGQQFFGALAVALHDSLLDDPTPYRHEVKAMLQHLLAWCGALPAAGVVVDRPNYSQRVRLLDWSAPTGTPTGHAQTPPSTGDRKPPRLDSNSRPRRRGRY
jgi:hypothetical protein